MTKEIANKLLALASDIINTDLDAALAILESVVKIDVTSSDAFRVLGEIYHKKGELDLAFANYERSVKLDPNDVNSFYTMGNIEMARSNFANAKRCYESAIAITEFPEGYINLGTAYLKLGDSSKYYDLLLSTIEKFPNYWIAFFNLGVYHYNHDNIEQAIFFYKKSLSINPENKLVKFSLSLALLKNKSYEQGFEYYENRWGTIPMCPNRSIKYKLWLGSDVPPCSSIIVTTEQGFGDLIQMMRYLFKIREIFHTVYLELKSPMVRLIKSAFPWIRTVEFGCALPDVNYYIPLMSLPKALNTNYDNIPRFESYISGIIDSKIRFSNEASLKVGLCWKGSQENPDMIHRSLRLYELSEIFNRHNIEWVSLVKEPTVDERKLLELSSIIDASSMMSDFYDTASIIKGLDAVVSVDTSVAHLSAAMGKKTLILLNTSCDWRWHLEDTHSAWYPTAQLFRIQYNHPIINTPDAIITFLKSNFGVV